MKIPNVQYSMAKNDSQKRAHFAIPHLNEFINKDCFSPYCSKYIYAAKNLLCSYASYLAVMRHIPASDHHAELCKTTFQQSKPYLDFMTSYFAAYIATQERKRVIRKKDRSTITNVQMSPN